MDEFDQLGLNLVHALGADVCSDAVASFDRELVGVTVDANLRHGNAFGKRDQDSSRS